MTKKRKKKKQETDQDYFEYLYSVINKRTEQYGIRDRYAQNIHTAKALFGYERTAKMLKEAEEQGKFLKITQSEILPGYYDLSIEDDF